MTSIDQEYIASAVQIRAKAMACAVPNGSSKIRTAIRKTMVGAMYCMMPMVERRKSLAPNANKSSGTDVTGPQPISSAVSVPVLYTMWSCPVAIR